MPRNLSGTDDISHAIQLLNSGNLPAAESICRTLLRSNPANADANNCLGVIYQRLGKPVKAAAHFRKTLAADPGHVPAYGNLANSLAQLGKMAEAKKVVAQALNLQPTPGIANRALGDLGYQVSEYSKADTFYQRAIAADSGDFQSYIGRGMSLRRLGRLTEALTCYDRAIQINPNEASTHLNRGNLLSDMGRLDDAAEEYRKAIRLKPDYARPYQLLAGVRKHSVYDAELKAMEALYKKSGLSTEDRMNLAFGLGKAFEDLEQYDKAFELFMQANQRKRSVNPYSISEDEKLFNRITTVFDNNFFKQHEGLGSDDKCPIFILGLPRSGTSLVEQILASHPQVHGAGELADLQIVCKGAVKLFPGKISQLKPDTWKNLANDYLQRLCAHNTSATFITDKMPENFLYIGMIATIFPNAKIIHCRRDPMDTCLSLFKNLFHSTGHQWCYDMEDLGRYYILYRDLMKHWDRVLPGRIYHIQYETLVSESEQQIRELLEYCEIPFDPACLAFYKSERAVNTLSFAQVRKPIYSSSVQLWKHYENHLQPLISKLCDA